MTFADSLQRHLFKPASPNDRSSGHSIDVGLHEGLFTRKVKTCLAARLPGLFDGGLLDECVWKLGHVILLLACTKSLPPLTVEVKIAASVCHGYSPDRNHMSRGQSIKDCCNCFRFNDNTLNMT